MQLLFNDAFFPITSNLGFIEGDCNVVANAFLRWQQSLQALGRSASVERMSAANLASALQSLLPLRKGGRSKILFLPTASQWTAYFDNGWQGAGLPSQLRPLAVDLRTRLVRASAIPNTYRRGQKPHGRYGGMILEIIDPVRAAGPLHYLRVINAVNDGGRWVFTLSGTQQPFEKPEQYGVRQVRERFTLELLDEYLHALGIDAFKEPFYLPTKGYLVYFHDTRNSTSGTISLEEVQLLAEGCSPFAALKRPAT